MKVILAGYGIIYLSLLHESNQALQHKSLRRKHYKRDVDFPENSRFSGALFTFVTKTARMKEIVCKTGFICTSVCIKQSYFLCSLENEMVLENIDCKLSCPNVLKYWDT